MEKHLDSRMALVRVVETYPESVYADIDSSKKRSADEALLHYMKTFLSNSGWDKLVSLCNATCVFGIMLPNQPMQPCRQSFGGNRQTSTIQVDELTAPSTIPKISRYSCSKTQN